MKERIELIKILIIVVEFIAFFAGLIVLKKLKPPSVKWMVAYLFIISCSELAGRILTIMKYKVQVSFLFEYFVIPLEFLFFYWFFYSVSSKSRFKKICLLFMFLSVVSRVVETVFFSNTKFFFSSFSYTVSNMLLLIIVIVHLIGFVKSDKILFFKKNIVIWISIALLIFYLGTFPFYAFNNFLWETEKKLAFFYWQLSMFLNMTMYLLFATGFIWTTSGSKYSSQ
ncbi:hypothetical protein [Ferruginibacter sp.]|nr:hypothetical protein [Ferruginibacter sp.]